MSHFESFLENNTIGFGKYKGKTLLDLVKMENNMGLRYLYWMKNNMESPVASSCINTLIEQYYEKTLVEYAVFPFGKYSGKSIAEVFDNDQSYIEYLYKKMKAENNTRNDLLLEVFESILKE